MANKIFLTGSQSFFSKFDDFKSKDKDIIILVDNPMDFTQVKQISNGSICKFYIARHTPEDYISWYLQTKTPMSVIKFLNKDFCDEIKFTIDNLKELAPTFERLDDKHKYAKVIFDAYIENNDFILNDEQLNNAYEVYKQYRVNNENDKTKQIKEENEYKE